MFSIQRVFLKSGSMFQVFYSSGKHQFDTVQLINLACTRVIINGYNVGFRVSPSDFFDDTFAHNVVWQASKRLDADNVGNVSVD